MASSRIEIVRARERLSRPEDQSQGMTREIAFATEATWIGRVTTNPGVTGGWHHHGTNDSYIYVIRGALRFEFGPGGESALDAAPGDFLFVPKETVHREITLSNVAAELVLFRTGFGPTLVNVADAPG